jgi:hypothetical protein
MTPTAMESGTIAEIDGWPGAMNMPRAARARLCVLDTLDSTKSRTRSKSGEFTFTLNCHLGKTHSHRSRGDTTWGAQSAAHTRTRTHKRATHKNTDTGSIGRKRGAGVPRW